MNKKIIFLTALAFILLLTPLTGYADGDKFGLGVRGGLYRSADADSMMLYGGAQVRWKLFPAMSLEATLDYRATESYPNNRKITSTPLLVSALFYIMPGANFSPYVLGGVGWYFSKIEDSSGSSTAYTPGLHLGAGLDIPLSPNIVINTDLRYFFLNYGDQKVNGLKTDGYIISAGVTFYLW